MALVVLALVSGSGSNDEEPSQAVATEAVSLLVALVTLLLAVRLLRGRRRLCLLLRRFGFEDATSTVTFAAAKVIGRSWRLVTLDDDRVMALGGSSGPRRVLGHVALLTVAAMALGDTGLSTAARTGSSTRTIAGTRG